MNSSILIQNELKGNMDKAKERKRKKVEEMDLDELISKFIAKDSQSHIQ